MHLALIIRTQEYYDLIKSSILLVFSTMGLIYLKFVSNLIKLSSVLKYPRPQDILPITTNHYQKNKMSLEQRTVTKN